MDQKTNVEGTANIIALCIENKVERLCYVSSVAAINRLNENEIINEKTEWKDSKENSNYAKSKYLAELEVWRGISQGVKAVIVNPTIIIGPGNWSRGSSAMFLQVWRGMKFYTHGTAGFVDVRDVVHSMIRLMESGVYSERFIVNCENLRFKEVFTWIAKYLRKPGPFISANAFLLALAWRVEAVKQVFSKTRPFITKETTISGRKKVKFSNKKIKDTIGIQFIPIEQSIEYTCSTFLKQHNK